MIPTNQTSQPPQAHHPSRHTAPSSPPQTYGRAPSKKNLIVYEKSLAKATKEYREIKEEKNKRFLSSF
jgi:hypothetical protein